MTKVLKLSASWCVPCKQMTTQIDRLNAQLVGVEIENIDIDENTEIAKKYNVRSIPTLLVLAPGGGVVRQSTGAMTDANLLRFLL